MRKVYCSVTEESAVTKLLKKKTKRDTEASQGKNPQRRGFESKRLSCYFASLYVADRKVCTRNHLPTENLFFWVLRGQGERMMQT